MKKEPYFPHPFNPKKLQKWQEENPEKSTARCCRCGFWWLKRVSEPKKCPHCRSKHWATARTNRQGMRPGT